MDRLKTFRLGLDVLRVLALVLVVITHSIVLTGSYTYSAPTFSWILTMALFYLSHSCVPLFLLLSGYLSGKKQLRVSYYRGLLRVLVPYVVISILCVLDAWLRQHDPGLKITTAIYQILSYRANGYGWYVEMYLGLFLLIPFLNLAYDAIVDQRWKSVLLGSLALLTLLPDTFSAFGTNQVRADILPDYFNLCYPITYYLLGRWIHEHEGRLTKKLGLILFAAGWLTPLGLCIFRSVRSGAYAGGYTLNTFGCLPTALCATGIFLLLFQQNGCSRLHIPIRKMSAVSFEAYLCSYLTDSIFYSYLKLPFPLMAVLSLCSALGLAALIHLVTQPIISGLQTQFDKLARQT